jgi:hypothetical protein
MAIARLRFGTQQLPNNENGRRFLRVLVGLKLPASETYVVAPWCQAELRGIVDQVNSGARVRTPDRIGAAIEFMFDELQKLARRGYSIRHVAPCDADRWKVQEFWRERRLEHDRIRKRRERAARPPKKAEEAKMAGLKLRTKIVRDALPSNWTSAHEIESRVALSFGLGEAALHVAVGRELKTLVKRGEAERTLAPGRNGRPTLFVRRSPPHVHMSGQAPVVHNTL